MTAPTAAAAPARVFKPTTRELRIVRGYARQCETNLGVAAALTGDHYAGLRQTCRTIAYSYAERAFALSVRIAERAP